MPLNLSNRDQNSGYLFYNRRLRAAITRFSVRMKHDDRKQQAALALSAVLVAVGCGWMALLGAVNPAGLAGESPIVGNRDTGALYARIDGRFYPALNLTSARLATGSAAAPVWVKSQEIGKHPTGPMIGIPGIPDDVSASANPVSAWAVCDTAAKHAGHGPTVTAIAGDFSGAGRADPMRPEQAILARHDNATYVIWNGRRSRIDAGDRAVTINLGIDATTRSIDLSNALFDAIPATEPLVVPRIAVAGRPSRWLPGSVTGQVLQVRNAGGEVSGFYILLDGGIQKITPFVADLLRTSDSHGSAEPRLIPPDAAAAIPEITVLHTDFYPTGKLDFVDTEANPVTCVRWTKRTTDPQASVSLFSGRGLPTPQQFDAHLVTLVRDSRGAESVEANQTLVLPGAANFVAATNGGTTGQSREGIFWVSAQGVRFGIERERATLAALAVDPDRAVQAPWPILRTFAAGPAITRADALLARDAIDPAGSAKILAGSAGG